MTNKRKVRKELKNFRNGDQLIVKQLYQRIIVYILAWRKTYYLNEEDVNDIAQNTMYHLILNLRDADIELSCKLSTYAIAFAKKQIQRFADNEKRFKRIKEETFIDEQLFSENVEDKNMEQKWKIFNAEFNKLSKECKTLIDLHIQEIRQKDIAKIAGYNSVNYVKKRIYLCRKKLWELIQDNPNYKKIKSYD